MSLFKSLDSIKPEVVESREMPKFVTVEMSVKTFVERLRQIDSLNDQQIQDIIMNQYQMLLDYDLFQSNLESRLIVQEMFTNERFLRNLVECAPKLTLSSSNKMCCNKVAYDYIAFTGNNANPIIKDLLIELSFRISTDLVMKLAHIIGVQAAKYLAIIYKSHYNESINILRVNRYLIRSGLELREQDMIEIYGALYENVTDLFGLTMMMAPEDDYNNLERYRYDEMTKCMIDILDNMTSSDIKNTLYSYAMAYDLKGEPYVRFSFRDLNDQYYGRIKTVVHELQIEGVRVP